MKPGETWSSIPEALLEDCAQLTKANSIEGNISPRQATLGTWLKTYRKQERQCHRGLHPMVKPYEERFHGNWPSLIPRPEDDQEDSSFGTTKCSHQSSE